MKVFIIIIKANIRSISANKQTDKNLNDMLFMSELLRRYLSERVDCSRFELYANFLCYSSRLQIIQDNWEDWSRFKETYPETDKYVPFFSVKAFSASGGLEILVGKPRNGLCVDCIDERFEIFQ